jgi:excisionase family DNA binding protein
MIQDEDMMNVKEIALYLRLCEVTVYKLLNDRKLPCFKVGHSWRSRRIMLDKFMADKLRMSIR